MDAWKTLDAQYSFRQDIICGLILTLFAIALIQFVG
jgi:hypothetical protein